MSGIDFKRIDCYSTLYHALQYGTVPNDVYSLYDKVLGAIDARCGYYWYELHVDKLSGCNCATIGSTAYSYAASGLYKRCTSLDDKYNLQC
jgi:hypothetical protein